MFFRKKDKLSVVENHNPTVESESKSDSGAHIREAEIPKIDPEEQFGLGCKYLLGYGGFQKDANKAVELFTLSAEQGFAYSEYNLGIIFENNNKEYFSDEPAYSTAFAYFLRAAEQGMPVAMEKVGEYYMLGLGVVQHYLKAKEWFLKASLYEGSLSALISLGDIYSQGLCVEKNLIEAYKFFSLASVKGNLKNGATDKLALIEKAAKLKAEIEPQLTKEDLVKAQDLAFEFKYDVLPEGLWL